MSLGRTTGRRKIRGAVSRARVGLCALIVLALPWGVEAFQVSFHDPRGDDRGPGTYTYPTVASLGQGAFDLVLVELSTEGEEFVVAVTFAGSLRPLRGVNLSADRRADLLVQAVDIYLDRDHVPGSGLTRAIPGRNVVLEAESAWEVALVLADRPFEIRSRIAMADPEVGERVLVTSKAQVKGRRWVGRFPLDQVGQPGPKWHMAVAITGVEFVSSFDVVGRLRSGTLPNVTTMDVQPTASDMAFGGCKPCVNHPRVIDILDRPGSPQREHLMAYTPERLAILPSLPLLAPVAEQAPVVPTPVAVERPPATFIPPQGVLLTVIDVARPFVTLQAPPGGTMVRGAILELMDEKGAVVAKVVVTQIMADLIIGQVVSGEGELRAGMRARRP